jgi:hypothetical protein
MLICFECRWDRAYREGKRVTEASQPLSPDEEPLLDKILSDAGVPLAKTAH